MTDSNQGRHLGVSSRQYPQIYPNTENEYSPTHPIDEHPLQPTAPFTTRDCTAASNTSHPILDASSTAENHVVVTIGIDRYAAWPHLGNAVNDARGTSDVFRKLGFTEASSLINETATGDAIRKLVTDDLSTLGVNDSLVIFFAGHGGTTTRVLADGTTIKTGYIIPVDAQNEHGHVATWIRLDTWLDEIARLPPKHVLVILDACHSGIALDSLVKWRDVNTWQSAPADELSRRRSRRVIVSALDDQLALDGGPVVGHSLFTGCLLQALTGDLPREGRQTATGTELGIHLQRRVREYPNSRQTPDFGAFELDDRGELRIPLFPLLLDPPPPIPIASTDTNAALRHKLAMTLECLVPDRTAIAHLVAAHAPMITITELPTSTTVTIWMYVLVELTNRGSFSEMSAVVGAARSRSRRSRRVDWSVFDPVLRPPAVPTVTNWSHLTLELPRDNAKTDRSGSALITNGGTLLEAVSTLHWRGMRPSDPLIKVTSSQLFGSNVPLLHETTLLPSHDPSTASWIVKIPVPHARIRTRKVTVRCEGTNLVERRYVVPRAGSICAAIVWLGFAAFVVYWLSSIRQDLVMIPLMIFGLLSGLWSSVGVHLLRVSQNKRSFRSLFFAWELAVLFAVLATMLVLVLEMLFRPVLVTNLTNKNIIFDNGKKIPANAKRMFLLASMTDLTPTTPFCRCNVTPGCQKSDLPLRVENLDHLVFGCIAEDCEHITEYVQSGGDATTVRPIGITVSPLVFEAGATAAQMKLSAGDNVAIAKNVVQLKGAAMKLGMLPDTSETQDYSIDFLNHGLLQCHARATRIVRFVLEQPVPHIGPIDITIGATHSTWTPVAGSSEARACAKEAVDDAQAFTLSTPDDKLRCGGGPVERVISLEVAPPASKLWVKIGDVESSWSSKSPSKYARACLGKQGNVELAPLTAGDQITLPKDLVFSYVLVRRDRVDPRLAIPVLCRPGDTVRAVKLVNISSHRTISVGLAHIEPLDATTGVTCDPPAWQREHDRACRLGTVDLVCSTPYQGDCRLLANNEVVPGGATERCPQPAKPADKQRAQQAAAAHNIICREVYQCE